MESAESKAEPRVKRAWGVVAAWMGGITAVVGFVGLMTGTFSQITEHFHHHAGLDAQVALAEGQAKQGEYAEALKTYGAILKSDPGYKAALDGQLATAERWVEDFHVAGSSGQEIKATAASWLDQIFPVFDAALSHAKGAQSAGILAHLGWAHWLNDRMTDREVGSTARQDLYAAVAADPGSVYANAMLGNFLVETNGSLAEAEQRFAAAVATGKERALVRRFEVGAYLFKDAPGVRAAVYKVANEMREGGEPMSADRKHDVLSFCCGVGMMSHDDLAESFSGVSQEDAWQTYLWLDDGPTDDENVRNLKRRFIQATLLELGGKRAEALGAFRKLRAELKDQNTGTTLDEAVDEAIGRLTHV